MIKAPIKTKKGERPRRYYAFTDMVSDPGIANPRLRLSAQFDVVDADDFDELEAGFNFNTRRSRTDRGLGIIRVMTTRGRLERMEVRIPTECDWLEIQIGPEPNTPRAWFAPAEGAFLSGPALNAPIILPIEPEGRAQLVRRLEEFCTAPAARTIAIKGVLDHLDFAKRKNLTITALDVGQASCTALAEAGRDFGYFDVGKPLVFNRRSFPKNFQRSYPSDGFVLLSHWDFDHYALAINNPELMALDWFAPKQKVGPYTAKFQRMLGRRLHFIDGNATAAGVLLRRGLGTDPRDRNATGYVLRLERDGEAILLTGDADYAHIPARLKKETTAIAVPHHGGKGSTPPKPAFCLYPTAVASYGTPNTYRHPDEKQLKAHRKKGWQVKRTARHGKPKAIPRSDQILFPLNQMTLKTGKKLPGQQRLGSKRG